MRLNKHSSERMKERVHKIGVSAFHKAQTALTQGVPRESLHGTLRRWADSKYFAHQDRGARSYYIHDRMVYIFAENESMITCLFVPRNLQDDATTSERRHRRRHGSN